MPERAAQHGSRSSDTGPAKRAPDADRKSRVEPAPGVGELPGAFDFASFAVDSETNDGRDRPEQGPSPGQLIALQRAVGNRAVARIVRTMAQRVPVSANTSETLYNQSNAAGQATARHYGGPKKYEMTRQGDTGVTVTVKIKFLNQARNTVPPPPGAPPGTPALGQLIGSPTEIPSNDPRRAWATQTASDAVAHWNGRLTFVGEEWNMFEANTRKRLPVTFQSIPVFGIGEEAHNTVIVHGPSVTAGTAGHPIDAGNYYMNKGSAYPASDDVIYAHEYGHLIGIPDEYSQSNEQMNVLLHQAAPGTAASSMGALDRATVERMVLAAMSRPLYAQLQAVMPTIAGAMNAQGALVKQKMSAAAREAVLRPAVRDQLRDVLLAESEAALDPDVPGVVAFQTTRNFSNVTRAAEGVSAAFSLGALSTQIGDAYWKALQAPHDTNVAVADFGDVSINVQGSVYSAAGSGTALAGNAGTLATSTVGAVPAPGGGGGGGGGAGAGGGGAGAGAGGGPPGLPAMPPPASLAGQITAIPGTWANAGSALETRVTADAFAAKMQAILPNATLATIAAALAGVMPGATGPTISRHRELYQRAYTLLNNAAKEASRQLAAELVGNAVKPVLEASVSSFQSAIGTEVSNVMTMSPSALAAAGNPNPDMRAIVNGMKSRLDAAKTATAGTGRDPLGSGGTAPAQDVTYSYQGLMGSNETTALRADQFRPMLDQFNDKLTNMFEKDFTAEVR